MVLCSPMALCLLQWP